MKKLLLILALSLPLMAQQVEVKEVDGKTEVTVKKQHDKKDWNRGDMRRGGGRMMEQRKQKARHMRKKRAIRSVVRIIVVGGLAYYIGYHQGEKHFKPSGMKRRPYMGDRK